MTENLLDIRGLRKSFGGTEVLRGVDLRVETGEVVAMIGASGSGKSTLLRCINCLEWPDAGSIRLAGEPIGVEQSGRGLRYLNARRIAAQRQRTGMVFQTFNLFPHWTVIRNVIEAPIHVRKLTKQNAKRQGLELLERVGLADRAESYPRQLSGGQQQRVSIARALAMEPSLLLFDEPTSALDPANVGEVTSVMEQLVVEGSTMIVVTHEVEFARAAASRVVVVDDGRIVREGPTSEVLDTSVSDDLEATLSGSAQP